MVNETNGNAVDTSISNDASKHVRSVFTKEILKNDPWPFDTDCLYRIAFNFFRDNESKAFHPSYDQRNTLVAYTLQEKHGKFNSDKARPLGALDFVGHDRRNAWIVLNDMSQDDARHNFIDLLDKLCPLFRPFVIAVKCDRDEKERKLKEEEENEKKRQSELEERERLKMEQEQKRIEEEKQNKFDEQKRIIQELLNRQTIHQFTSYAKQQYPDNTELQEQLINRLQEQHFQQYMQQLMEQSNETKSDIINNNGDSNGVHEDEDKLASHIQDLQLKADNKQEESLEPNSFEDSFENGDDDEEESDDEDDDADGIIKSIENASMWTRKDVSAFKESIQAEGSNGVLKVGHGEIATIRVPTHDDGNCIFWEFATDSYDIGFGLFFEWTSTPDNQVSVHISESEDEDDEDEGEVDISTNDVEKGAVAEPAMKPIKLNENNMPISVIIPIYRRDSHEEVFAGSHNYPGKGVYLLKFDNSYSLWRSKTLYYRVYYTREP